MRKAPLLTGAALILSAALVAPVPAQAGVLINRDGVFLTDPDPSLLPAVNAEGGTRFGGPATGFRRFGRDGYFALPRDPGLPFHGRTAFGGAGRAFDDALRARRLPREPSSIFSLSYWGLVP